MGCCKVRGEFNTMIAIVKVRTNGDYVDLIDSAKAQLCYRDTHDAKG